MIRKILMSIVFIILITLSIIGIYYMFNGGITNWDVSIRTNGFFQSIGLFFKEIWTGFRSTFGL